MILPLFSDAELPSLVSLYGQINADMGNGHIWVVLIWACMMLAIHGVAVLAIAGAFHSIDQLMTKKRIFGGSFVAYFLAILLVIASHLCEIVAWAYLCVALKVFPSDPQTFYFAGEMYTTVGFGSYQLSEHWRILPIIISFSGIFAVSMSGAALYSMMGALLGHGYQNNQASPKRPNS